jgi:hypothetical protein
MLQTGKLWYTSMRMSEWASERSACATHRQGRVHRKLGEFLLLLESCVHPLQVRVGVHLCLVPLREVSVEITRVRKKSCVQNFLVQCGA